MAHIGVIHQLEERGLEIASISGCSIGALIAGVYAAGKLTEFERWVSSITRLDMVNLLDVAWARDGLVKGEKIIGTLVELIGDVAIEDLPIPYTAVATDIINEKEVWLNSGALFDAIRASISLPLFFTPILYNEIHLIDGGVVNPVPIAPTFNDDTDITIAVNLGGPPGTFDDRPSSEATSTSTNSFTQKVTDFIRDLQPSASSGEADRLGVYDVANRAFDAMQSTIARQKLAAYPPDVVIEIPRDACGTFEFDRAAQMIQLGRSKTRECSIQT
jgi:NTE family protein